MHGYFRLLTIIARLTHFVMNGIELFNTLLYHLLKTLTGTINQSNIYFPDKQI